MAFSNHLKTRQHRAGQCPTTGMPHRSPTGAKASGHTAEDCREACWEVGSRAGRMEALVIITMFARQVPCLTKHGLGNLTMWLHAKFFYHFWWQLIQKKYNLSKLSWTINRLVWYFGTISIYLILNLVYRVVSSEIGINSIWLLQRTDLPPYNALFICQKGTFLWSRENLSTRK